MIAKQIACITMVAVIVVYLAVYGFPMTLKEGLTSSSENCGCTTTAPDDVDAAGVLPSHIGGGNRWCWLGDHKGTVAEQEAWCRESTGCEVQGRACVTKTVPPCRDRWFRDASGSGKCVQTCPLDTQTRNEIGQCKCGLGTPNEKCIGGYNCINNVCVEAETGNCYIKINGTCKGNPKLDKWSGYWFSDEHMTMHVGSGNTATKCDARKASWQTSCGASATIDNKFLLSGAPVNTPCDIQDVTKVGDPDANGTGNAITNMNPDGIKIYNLDVSKIFKTTSYNGFLYFYPNQLTGWNLYADPILKTSTDSNGTLYLHTHMNPDGVKINASSARCFEKATHLYIGGPPWGNSTALQACTIPQNLGTNIVGGKTNGCKAGAALKSGDSCTIACKPGYKLSGGAVDSYSCTNAKLTAGNIQCKPITCNIPKSFGIGIEGSGTSACKSGNILNVNESCDVGCKTGYKAVSGTTAYTCDGDGNPKRASLVCNKLPATKKEKIVVKEEGIPSVPQVTCICESPSTNPSCPAHRNYTQHDHQYGLGHKSGYDRYHHEHDVIQHHQGPQSSSRRVPNTYDDYYRTTSFPQPNVKPYNSLMNLFL